MAIFQKFASFVEALAEKVHDLQNDSLKIALVAFENPPLFSRSKLSDLIEISYAYCSSRNVTVIGSAQVAGVYKLLCADLTIRAIGGSVGPFRYIVLYNDSATNKELIGWYNYGVDIVLADGENFVLHFNQLKGVITLQ